MGFDLTSLFGFFTASISKFFTDSMAKVVAYKAMIFTFFTVTLPVVLKNLIVWLFETTYDIITANIDFNGIDSTVIAFTGIGAYLASHLMLADCLSVILAAMGIRFILNLIPLVG